MDRTQRILHLCDQRALFEEGLESAAEDNDGESLVVIMQGLHVVNHELRLALCDA